MSKINQKFTIYHMLLFSIVITIIGSVVTFYFTQKHDKRIFEEQNSEKYCDYNVKRIKGLKFVKPILWVDENCESDELLGLKQKLTEIIEKYKQSKGVTNASIYLRVNSHWTVVNENEKYEPGSLFKVPILITILRMDEEQPGFLNKVITYKQEIKLDKKINFPSKSIELGKSYTIKELLTYMIKYSDNAATVLLEQNMNNETLQKLFSDIGLEVPSPYADRFEFTARDYSYFMRAIFNAGYLTIKNSEFAAELLSECEFKEGICRGLPKDTKIAHKFGETGSDSEKQLHESAVVYLEDKGYLLTIMTKGKDMKTLSDLLGELSQTIYTDVKNNQ